LFKKLDKVAPLGGPKYVNWRNVIMTIATPIIVAILLFSGNKFSAACGVYYGLPAQVAENTEAIQSALPKLDQILVILKNQEVQRMTVTGEVIVTNSTTHTEGCIWLNEFSNARVHAKAKYVRVTNLTGPSKRSVVLAVKGTISRPDNNVVGEICGAAARMLHVEEALNLIVKISPLDQS
jgi:hypothetical protein